MEKPKATDEEGSAKKRARDDDRGFGTPAAKIAAKLGADICITMGTTMQLINDTLAPCKTLKDFKRARAAVEQHSVNATGKVALLTLTMMRENAPNAPTAKE